MSERTDGGPAFARPLGTDEHDQPCNVSYDQEGMSLRDYFAAHALAGLLAQRPKDKDAAYYAIGSFVIADTMLKYRNT